MLCPRCKIDMLVKENGPDGLVFICVNPRCPQKDVPVTVKNEQHNSSEEGA